MKGQFVITLLVIIGLLVLLDLYSFKGLKLLMQGVESVWVRRVIKWGYWATNIGLYLLLTYPLISMSEGRSLRGDRIMSSVFGVLILFLIPKLTFCVFHLIEDISFLGYFLTKKVKVSGTGEVISRYKFITTMGAVIATIPFFGILYGIIKGKYDFEVIKKTIAFKSLPLTFNGTTIVHISDMHLGSFEKKHPSVAKAVQMINDLNADYVLFTGDIVNNYGDETDGWGDVLSKITAKKGKFSVLGNHDYGEYTEWSNESDKLANFNKIKGFHKTIGFELLTNENRTIEKDGEKIHLIGLENWGAGGFSKHGDLPKASKGIDENIFTILMSHDPSHWDAQVLRKKNIELTLAGHTHGMQFGVRLGDFQYSPVQHRYPRWSGLYTEDKQHLYVNKGFGYIGFPGRVGMPPEITLLTLESA